MHKTKHILDRMADIVNRHVKNYVTDFYHDKRILAERSGSFVWIVRTNGTDLIILEDENPHEVRPYLFGSCDHMEILDGYISCLADPRLYEDAQAFFYLVPYTNTIKEFTREQAKQCVIKRKALYRRELTTA